MDPVANEIPSIVWIVGGWLLFGALCAWGFARWFQCQRAKDWPPHG